MRRGLLVLLFLGANSAFAQSLGEGKPWIDTAFVPAIKTVLLHPSGSDSYSTPLLPLGSNNPLVLSFDELGSQPRRLVFELVHCNADWLTSRLQPIQFMDDYYVLPITSLQYSLTTVVPYIHYQIELPIPTRSGNYAVMVYPDGYRDQPVLTRRFFVLDQQVSVSLDVTPPTVPGERFTHQQVAVQVSHPGYLIASPGTELIGSIRRNFGQEECPLPRPRYVDPGRRQVKYDQVTEAMRFPGGNEFWTLDLRSSRFAGIGAGYMVRDSLGFLVSVLCRSAKPQSSTYLTRGDLDGQMLIDQYEYGDGVVNADYVRVRFCLKGTEADFRDLRVIGSLSDWGDVPESRFVTDPVDPNSYAELLVKQGYYNYAFAEMTRSGLQMGSLEGDFNQTQNTYEVFLYHRQPGAEADQLVGYFRTNDSR